MKASGINVEVARTYLRDLLPADQAVEIEDPDVLDAAAAVIVICGRARKAAEE